LHTDASKYGIGGILLQYQQDGTLKPICYFSRQTNKAEQNYHSYELETLAVVESMRCFRIYLLNNRFTVLTDCNAMTKKDLVPRIERWWLLTHEFDFDVVYRPGTKMVHVDALSRNSIKEKGDEIEEDIHVFHLNRNEDDWILAAQLKDETCKQLHTILSRTPNGNEEKKIHDKYTLKMNRVYKVTLGGSRWVVPKTARSQIVFYHHDNVGHFGAEKTLDLVKQKYWLPQMNKYIKRCVSCCLACMYNKEPTGKQTGFPTPKFDIPMHTLHIDHLGPFVSSPRKNAYLIVVIDGFTKFVFLKAVRNTKVDPLLKFLDGIFNIFDVTRRSVCDRGSSFTSKCFNDYCKRMSIKVNYNATATPRANSKAERYNTTILNALSTSTDNENKWDESVHHIQWGLNMSSNKTTGKTPYEFFIGIPTQTSQ
jgi:hypothetical protein